MRIWDDVVGTSSAWSALSEFRATIDEFEGASPGHGALDRPRHLAFVAEAQLRAVDPELAVGSTLDAFANDLRTLASVLREHFAPAEGTPERPREDVDNAADAVATSLARLPGRPVTEPESAAVIDALRQQLNGLLAQAHQSIDQVASETTAASAQHMSDLDARDQAASAISSRIDELEARLQQIDSEATELLVAKRSEFDGAEAQRATTFTSEAAAHEARLQAILGAAQASLSETLAAEKATYEQLILQQGDEGEKALTRLRTLLEDAETVVGAIGRTGLTGGFHEWEETERKAADELRDRAMKYGLAAACAIGVMLLIKLLGGHGEGLDATLTVGSVALPGALGGIAAYSAQESTKHRRNQVIARRTEIELKSFGPFLGPVMQ